MDNIIKSDLNQFTYTAWFKIAMGLRWFQLLSYMVHDVDGYINLGFETESENSHVVRVFRGQVAKDPKRYGTGWINLHWVVRF